MSPDPHSGAPGREVPAPHPPVDAGAPPVDAVAPPGHGEHERTSRFLLGPFERVVLPRLADALPPWVKPDHLTLLGVLASTAMLPAYWLSNRAPGWLWVASALLVVQWYGDSLDGTVARRRDAQRPRYGYYLDHLVDAYSTFAIGLGIGLSPYMLVGVGLSIAAVYLMLSINVYLETHAFGEFEAAYGRLGPTEMRLVIIGVNTVAFFGGAGGFRFGGQSVTVLDFFAGFGAFGMLLMLLVRALRNLRRLARLEPPRA